MEAELFIGLPADIVAAATTTYELPKERRYLIQNTAPKLTRWSGGSMTHQNLEEDNFIAELMIVDVNKPLTADLWIKKANAIFFYTIKGYFTYRNSLHTFQILQDESAIFQVQPGHFKMRILAGYHVYFFFYLKPGLLKKLASEYEGLKPLLTFTAEQSKMIRPAGKIANQITQTLFRLRQVRKEGKIAALNREGIILELATSTQSKLHTGQILHETTTRDIVLGITEFIADQISQGAVPSIRAMADLYHLTPRRLSEVFRDLFGLPLRDYINQRRMVEGHRLLTEEHMPVASVARHLGYQDAANFSRSFKNYFGFPPSDASAKK